MAADGTVSTPQWPARSPGTGAANFGDRVFDVQFGRTVTISAFRSTTGTPGNTAGRPRNLGGFVTLTDVWFTDNKMTGFGGMAIYNDGSMTLDHVQIDDSSGGVASGVIYSTGTLTVAESSIYASSTSRRDLSTVSASTAARRRSPTSRSRGTATRPAGRTGAVHLRHRHEHGQHL